MFQTPLFCWAFNHGSMVIERSAVTYFLHPRVNRWRVCITTGCNLMSGIKTQIPQSIGWKGSLALLCTVLVTLSVWTLKRELGSGQGLILWKWCWSPSGCCWGGWNDPAAPFCLPVQSNRMCTEEANCWEKLLLVCMTDQERSKFISDSLRQIFL